MMAAVSRGAVSCLSRSSSCHRYRCIVVSFRLTTMGPLLRIVPITGQRQRREGGKATHAVESVLDELVVRSRVRETHLVPVGVRGCENARLWGESGWVSYHPTRHATGDLICARPSEQAGFQLTISGA